MKARSKAKPELHWISGSPYAWRVMLALEVKQVPYVSRLLESSRGDLKTPEFLRLNPRGQVPVLTHGDYVLTESLAILAYLDREFPAPPILGEHPYETAQIWRIISEFLSYLSAPLGRVVTPIYGGKAAEKAEDIQAAMPAVHAELARLEQTLGSATWLATDRISAADIVLYPSVRSLLRAAAKEAAAPLNLGLLPLRTSYPRLAAWIGEVERVPGYERTFPPHWKERQAA
jgi:glutathione S-transferase